MTLQCLVCVCVCYMCINTLLSSMTVLSDSIHMGSMSPSSTNHFGLSLPMLDKSLIMVENRPVKYTTNINTTVVTAHAHTHQHVQEVPTMNPTVYTVCVAGVHTYIPSFHSLVAGLMEPKSSFGVTALGLRSTHMGFFFSTW